jgi:hypothetical protein
MASPFYYFGEVVFPICEIEVGRDELKIVHFQGTCFTIGTAGFFLSAKHVINEQCFAQCPAGHALIGLAKPVDSGGRRWTAAKITQIESHPACDVAIGKIDHAPPSFFTSHNQDAYGWEDVHVFGYPESRTRDRATGLYEFNPHFLKGYISRRLDRKDVPQYGPSYELSFPIPLGVSGSPVFRRGPEHSLLGIALASLESAISVHEVVEVDEKAGKYSEKVQKIEQFGIAIRLAALADWTPAVAGGKRLGELY